MVESRTERDGRIAQERRYYLCSTKLDAETFARVVRSHWGIESVPQGHTGKEFAMN
jgi:predicted transposase YbfD/YdcC